MFAILYHAPKLGPVFASSLGGWQVWGGENVLTFSTWRQAKDHLIHCPAGAKIVQI